MSRPVNFLDDGSLHMQVHTEHRKSPGQRKISLFHNENFRRLPPVVTLRPQIISPPRTSQARSRPQGEARTERNPPESKGRLAF